MNRRLYLSISCLIAALRSLAAQAIGIRSPQIFGSICRYKRKFQAVLPAQLGENIGPAFSTILRAADCSWNAIPLCLQVDSLSAIGDNMFLLVGIIACDESQDRFGGAEIDRFVRHVGFDINEISRFTDNRIL